MLKLTLYFLLCCFLSPAFFSCSDASSPVDNSLKENKVPDVQKTKPASSYNDTLTITGKAAVFYEPDSLQLTRIKAVTEDWIYGGSMHEYEYQQKSANKLLKRDWPDVKVIRASNVRFLQFVRVDGKVDMIDLDQKNDPYGLFVFNRLKAPRQIEMTNAESLIPDYFTRD
jgi:hypothetical protein